MGWASGSRLFLRLIEAIKQELPEDAEKRERIYREMFDAFEDADWDTTDECLGEDPAYDKIHNEKYPPEDE